ncbi:glycosyltransferase family 2 protein [Terrabacter sp. GCM10028922]|uniref:glycosyltransferase family 2 protein n=1 Tax=Terrabacter sp. GCM10028922 TaxID=3273428 RepID=UPI003616C8D4
MSPEPGPRVTVVVATRNRWDDLRRSLPRHHPAPVVLVDNASDDATPQRVAEAFPDVRVIRLARNAGAVARNVGVAEVETPYVAFADDDSWWEPGALDRAADLLDANPQVGLIAARVLVGEPGVLEPVCAAMSESALETRPGEPGRRVLGFIACGAVVRRSAYLQAGGFDPVVFFAGEEERLALDLAAHGWALCYVPEVVARHVPSTARDVRARHVRVARNIMLTAVMRRPVREVLRTARRTARGRHGVRGLLAAVPRVPAALRARRPLPPDVEAARRLLDAAAS